jgi:hypothetical protein
MIVCLQVRVLGQPRVGEIGFGVTANEWDVWVPHAVAYNVGERESDGME